MTLTTPGLRHNKLFAAGHYLSAPPILALLVAAQLGGFFPQEKLDPNVFES